METEKQFYYSNKDITTVNHELDRLISSQKLSPALLANILEHLPIPQASPEQPPMASRMTPSKPQEAAITQTKQETPTGERANLSFIAAKLNGPKAAPAVNGQNPNFRQENPRSIPTPFPATRPLIPNANSSTLQQPPLRNTPLFTSPTREKPVFSERERFLAEIQSEREIQQNRSKVVASRGFNAPPFTQKETRRELSNPKPNLLNEKRWDSVAFKALPLPREILAETAELKSFNQPQTPATKEQDKSIASKSRSTESDIQESAPAPINKSETVQVKTTPQMPVSPPIKAQEMGSIPKQSSSNEKMDSPLSNRAETNHSMSEANGKTDLANRAMFGTSAFKSSLTADPSASISETAINKSAAQSMLKGADQLPVNNQMATFGTGVAPSMPKPMPPLPPPFLNVPLPTIVPYTDTSTRAEKLRKQKKKKVIEEDEEEFEHEKMIEDIQV